MSDPIIKAEEDKSLQGFILMAGYTPTQDEQDSYRIGFKDGWHKAVTRQVDPTQFVEHVCKTIYERDRASGVDLPTWEDLGALDKQEMKQGVLALLYDTLGALADQGLIGGIDSRG